MIANVKSIAVLFFLATGAAVAADAPPRDTGNYIMLLDEGGKPVAGAYWLSPDLKISVRVPSGGFPVEPVFVDREYFPQRRAIFGVFDNMKISYSPDPQTVDIGKTQRILRKTEPTGGMAHLATAGEMPMKYTMIGRLASTLGGFDLINRFYTIERYDLVTPDDYWGKRVYIETLDMDLTDKDAARVSGIETGTALSSGDFYLAMMVKMDGLPELISCLRQNRASPGYAEKAKRQREGSDTWMTTTFLTSGRAFWEQKDLLPDYDDMDIYKLCP